MARRVVRTAFVPRIIFQAAFVGVIPACAVGCGGESSTQHGLSMRATPTARAGAGEPAASWAWPRVLSRWPPEVSAVLGGGRPDAAGGAGGAGGTGGTGGFGGFTVAAGAFGVGAVAFGGFGWIGGARPTRAAKAMRTAATLATAGKPAAPGVQAEMGESVVSPWPPVPLSLRKRASANPDHRARSRISRRRARSATTFGTRKVPSWRRARVRERARRPRHAQRARVARSGAWVKPCRCRRRLTSAVR